MSTCKFAKEKCEAYLNSSRPAFCFGSLLPHRQFPLSHQLPDLCPCLYPSVTSVPWALKHPHSSKPGLQARSLQPITTTASRGSKHPAPALSLPSSASFHACPFPSRWSISPSDTYSRTFTLSPSSPPPLLPATPSHASAISLPLPKDHVPLPVSPTLVHVVQPRCSIVPSLHLCDACLSFEIGVSVPSDKLRSLPYPVPAPAVAHGWIRARAFGAGWFLCWWGGSCGQQDISEHLCSLPMRCQELSMSGFDNEKWPLANAPGRVESPHPQLSPTGLQSPFSAFTMKRQTFPSSSFLKSPQAPFHHSWSVSKPLSVFRFLSFASRPGGESWDVFTLPPPFFVPQTFFGCCGSQCAWNAKSSWEEKDTGSASKEFKFTG